MCVCVWSEKMMCDAGSPQGRVISCRRMRALLDSPPHTHPQTPLTPAAHRGGLCHNVPGHLTQFTITTRSGTHAIHSLLKKKKPHPPTHHLFCCLI